MGIHTFSVFREYEDLIAFTVTGGNEPVEDVMKSALQDMGVTKPELVRLGQVHGSRIAEADKGGVYPETDASVSSRRGVFQTLRTADCIPVFLYSPSRQRSGLVHAGWRGLSGNILEKALDRLVPEGKRDDLRAALGPSIRKCCYEVGAELCSVFPDDWEDREGRIFLSIQENAMERLLKSGLKREHIEDSGICSCCGGNEYFSYRRNATEQRMISVMGVKTQ